MQLQLYVVGPAAREAIRNLKDGEILLLENIRIHTEETIIFEEQLKLSPQEQAKTILVRKLAPLADIYLCDAFACVHRSEPSLVGFPEVLPSGCGRFRCIFCYRRWQYHCRSEKIQGRQENVLHLYSRRRTRSFSLRQKTSRHQTSRQIAGFP